MNLVKFGACWINPKHISCVKIKEIFSEFKHKLVYKIVVFCYGNEVAYMYYDHRKDAELILNKVIIRAMEESDNDGITQS